MRAKTPDPWIKKKGIDLDWCANLFKEYPHMEIFKAQKRAPKAKSTIFSAVFARKVLKRTLISFSAGAVAS